MAWKAPWKIFSYLDIADWKIFYTSFWSFCLHLKTCKRIFEKFLILCRVFCNVFESGTTLGKVAMATIRIMPHQWSHHHFIPTSWAKSTESFIKISLALSIPGVKWSWDKAILSYFQMKWYFYLGSFLIIQINWKIIQINWKVTPINWKLSREKIQFTWIKWNLSG